MVAHHILHIKIGCGGSFCWLSGTLHEKGISCCCFPFHGAFCTKTAFPSSNSPIFIASFDALSDTLSRLVAREKRAGFFACCHNLLELSCPPTSF
jgi:hypothetical protein